MYKLSGFGTGDWKKMNWKICFVMVLAIAIGQAEEAPVQKKTAPKPASPTAELKLPAGATMVEPGTYTFTDTKGKKWIYRKTPFGLSRAEDKPTPADAAPAPPPGAGMTATEDGDTVRFERPGPFGVYRWQKKKSELDDDERAALEHSQPKSASTEKAKQE
jgi:hypothetical protein